MEFQCRVIVQRRCTSCCSSVENIPLQAEHHSARRQKPFAFPPESCSPSDRNAVRNHNGIVFGFRAESRSPSTGFPSDPDKVAQNLTHYIKSFSSKARQIFEFFEFFEFEKEIAK